MRRVEEGRERGVGEAEAGAARRADPGRLDVVRQRAGAEIAKAFVRIEAARERRRIEGEGELARGGEADRAVHEVRDDDGETAGDSEIRARERAANAERRGLDDERRTAAGGP